MKISVYNRQKNLPISVPSIKKSTGLLLEFLRVTTDEVVIHFVTKKKISALHKEFFDDPSPTDCISFPYEPSGYAFLGEIFICPEVAQEYAEENQKNVQEEISLYLIHGLLHLLGYDDLNAQDRKKMRRKEKECLQFLAKKFL